MSIDSTTFRAKDLHLSQTLSSIVTFLLVIEEVWLRWIKTKMKVKVTNPGSCDETKVKVVTKWMWRNELPREYIGYK